MPQVYDQGELKLFHGLEVNQGVGHAHEVARLNESAINRIGCAFVAIGGIHDGSGVAPRAVRQQRDVLATQLSGEGTPVHKGAEHVVAHAELTAVHRSDGAAAMTGRSVEVVRQADDGIDSAACLDGVGGMLFGDAVLDAAVTVTAIGIERGGIDGSSLLDLVGGNPADLSNGFRVVMVHVLDEILPGGLNRHGLTG